LCAILEFQIFSGSILHDLLTYCKIRPAIHQIERHPYLQQEELVQYCISRKIQIVNYSSLGNVGFLKSLGSNEHREFVLLEEPIIKKISEKI